MAPAPVPMPRAATTMTILCGNVLKTWHLCQQHSCTQINTRAMTLAQQTPLYMLCPLRLVTLKGLTWRRCCHLIGRACLRCFWVHLPAPCFCQQVPSLKKTGALRHLGLQHHDDCRLTPCRARTGRCAVIGLCWRCDELVTRVRGSLAVARCQFFPCRLIATGCCAVSTGAITLCESNVTGSSAASLERERHCAEP